MTPTARSPLELLETLQLELRWFLQLRWIGGLTIIFASVVGALVTRWTDRHVAVAVIGGAVLLYNAVFWWLLRPGRGTPGARSLWASATLQIAFDLIALSSLCLLTGGLSSPLLWMFVLHMVLSCLLLPTMVAYLSALLAMTLVLGGLWVTDRWPRDDAELRLALGWMLLLLLTTYVTSRITANLRRKERQIRDEGRRTAAILSTAADAIITIGARGTIRSVNPAVERIFGYERREMIGRNVKMLMPEPESSEHDGYLERYLDTGHARIIGIGREVQGRRKDGTVFPAELAVSEVRLDDDERLFTGIIRDITDRKRIESELRSLNDRLRRQQRMLVQSEKMAAMGQMAAGVAHEIANPLASMDSLLQLVERQPQRLDDRTGRLLREQIGRITSIVQQMTDFAHPNATGWEVRSLNDVVSGALDILRFDHRLRRVDVVRSLGDDVGSLRLVPQAVHQIAVNLVMNAVDALEDVEQPRLEVRTRRDDDACVLEVMDNGAGIAPEHLGRVFEPFFTTKPVGRGTGLGLSITYSLVQQHGGRCEVRSEPGVGTTVSIFLPEDPTSPL